MYAATSVKIMYVCVFAQMLSMQAKLDHAHKDYLSLKMDVEDEANSLKQQILVMQKVSMNDDSRGNVLRVC